MFKNTDIFEAGLIAVDSFQYKEILLLKHYGYYAIQATKGKEPKYRDWIRVRERDRPAEWNGWKEKSWSNAKLLNVPDSIAQNLMAQALQMGATEVKSCITPIHEDGEQRRFIINNSYIVEFTSHRKRTGTVYDVDLYNCMNP